ncbi:50S ribosomal protein L31e [Candidatus Bathyarchaeota archaeon]|nr:50S ribosomal protein L31e [Candidatus Bathyarchaeota archaeon]
MSKEAKEQVSEEVQVEEKVVKAEEAVSEEKTADEIEELLAEDEPAEEPLEAEEEAAPAEEEEAKPRRGKKKEEEEEFVEERVYTIPLGKAWVRPPKKRAPRAMQLIKDFVTKHMKLEMRVEEEEEKEELPRLIISNDVNEKVWSRSIEKPPRKIRVRAAKDKEGNVTVFLAEGE